MMTETAGAIQAGDQLKQAAAIAHAVAMVMAPKNQQAVIRRETRRLMKAAYPEVKIHG